MLIRLAYPLALLLAAALGAAAWLHSYSRVDIFFYQPYYDQGNSPDVQYHARLDQGLLQFGGLFGNEEAWQGTLGHTTRPPAIAPFPFFHWENTTAYNTLPDCYYFDATFLGLGFRRYGYQPGNPRLHWWTVSVPLWLLTCLPLVLAVRPFLRACRRPAPTACPACGYDIRAHLPNSVLATPSSALPPRCPECGTPIPSRPPANDNPPAPGAGGPSAAHQGRENRPPPAPNAPPFH